MATHPVCKPTDIRAHRVTLSVVDQVLLILVFMRLRGRCCTGRPRAVFRFFRTIRCRCQSCRRSCGGWQTGELYSRNSALGFTVTAAAVVTDQIAKPARI